MTVVICHAMEQPQRFEVLRNTMITNKALQMNNFNTIRNPSFSGVDTSWLILGGTIAPECLTRLRLTTDSRQDWPAKCTSQDLGYISWPEGEGAPRTRPHYVSNAVR